MDELLTVLKLVQERLDEADIPNAAIGGLVLAAWGRPRATDDVDLKVAATRSDIQRLVELMAPEFRPTENAVEFARGTGVLFFDSPEGIRVDLLLADLGFDFHAIERAVSMEVQPGFFARICTAEDIILYKSITMRPLDAKDVSAIIQEQGERLDLAYIEHWLQLFEEALDDSTLVESFRAQCAALG